MSKITLTELLQQDIEDLKELVFSQELNKELSKQLAKGIIANLEDHLENLIQIC